MDIINIYLSVTWNFLAFKEFSLLFCLVINNSVVMLFFWMTSCFCMFFSLSLDTVFFGIYSHRFSNWFYNFYASFNWRTNNSCTNNFFTLYSLSRNNFGFIRVETWRMFSNCPHTRPQRFVDRQRLKPLRKPLALTSDTTCCTRSVDDDNVNVNDDDAPSLRRRRAHAKQLFSCCWESESESVTESRLDC